MERRMVGPCVAGVTRPLPPTLKEARHKHALPPPSMGPVGGGALRTAYRSPEADMGTVNLGEGQLVTLIVAIDNIALQMDIAIAMRELDPDDPRRPGDIIWHNADVDRDAFLDGLDVAVQLLRRETELWA